MFVKSKKRERRQWVDTFSYGKYNKFLCKNIWKRRFICLFSFPKVFNLFHETLFIWGDQYLLNKIDQNSFPKSSQIIWEIITFFKSCILYIVKAASFWIFLHQVSWRPKSGKSGSKSVLKIQKIKWPKQISQKHVMSTFRKDLQPYL